ncbi:hypothetical protein JL720_10066 [Aureococcus anophagefferens]|nr:hypothetical protein JL720_10066 [Aureococcus anophagefferens]
MKADGPRLDGAATSAGMEEGRVPPRTPNSAGHAAGPAASGGSEEAARDTARPRTEDLEDGVPLPLRAHGLEALRALAAASANTAERRVQKKSIQFDAARSSWQHLFDPSKSDSLLARGYAAKGGTGADYGRYWITAAGLEYLAAWTAPTSPTPTPTRIWT